MTQLWKIVETQEPDENNIDKIIKMLTYIKEKEENIPLISGIEIERKEKWDSDGEKLILRMTIYKEWP